MKKFFCLILLVIFNIGIIYPQCYNLVWSDEFDYSGSPDSLKWNYEIWPPRYVNDEEQAYTGREKNIRVEDGKLIIQAHKEDTTVEGVAAHYTSGRINSARKGDWTYGRIEAYAKLPGGQGTWPAIWMMPTDGFYGGWPNSGEVDIMEYVGCDPGIIHGSIHTQAYNHTIGTQKTGSQTGNVEDEYHLYAVEWDDEKIDFYFDTIKYFTFINEHKTHAEWPYDKPFHIILNLAIGGSWGGYCGPVDQNIFPVQLEIDYVRVYQKTEDIVIKGDTLVKQSQLNTQYSLPDIEGALYEWTLPEGAIITSNPDSNIIHIDWGCKDGPVKCTLITSCDTSIFSLDVNFEEIEIIGSLFVSDTMDNMLFYVPELKNTTYFWEVPDDAVIKEGQGTDSILMKWGYGSDTIKLILENECDTQQIFRYLRYYGQYPYPNPDVPHALPGIIKAVEYDYGGEGEAYHDLEPANQVVIYGRTGPRLDEGVDTEFNDQGNPNVGWISNGEWLEYTISAPDTVVFFAIRVTTDYTSGGPFNVLINGEDRLGDISVSYTGGWSNFLNLMVGEIHLYPTDTLLKLDFVNGGFNVSEIIFMERETEPPTTPENLKTSLIKSNSININWDESIDNIGVAGYIVYVNGEENQRVTSTSAKITDLQDTTIYTIAVAAYDEQKNESGKAEITATTLSEPVNVSDQSVNNLYIYPNPVHNELYIESEIVIDRIFIFNAIGQKLIEKNVSSIICYIDLSSMEPGLYLASVYYMQGLISRRKIYKY